MPRSITYLLLGALLLIEMASEGSSLPGPSLDPSGSPAPAAAQGPSAAAASPGIPAPSGAPVPSASPARAWDARGLLKEFQRAQYSELKALEHRQKLELAEQKSSQKARLKAWEKSEEVDRHKYFADHRQGEDQRAYVHDFIRRRETLLKDLADQRTKLIADQAAVFKALKDSQASKLSDFKSQLAKGQKPDEGLWPKGD